MASKYKWALNESKLARAVGKLAIDATEAELQGYYIEIGGLIQLSEIITTKPMDEETNIPAEQVADDVETSTETTEDTHEEVKADLETPHETSVEESAPEQIEESTETDPA